jgi:hypothetical protein
MECAICEEVFDSDHVPVQVDGCRHVFGQECLAMWVNSNNEGRNKCPNCRKQLSGEDPPAAQSQGGRQVPAPAAPPPPPPRAPTLAPPHAPTPTPVRAPVPAPVRTPALTGATGSRGLGQHQAGLYQLSGHAGVILGFS